MKRFMLIAVVLLLGFCSSSYAQHPCDTGEPPAPTTARTPVKFGWCHDQLDVDGFPVGSLSFTIYIDGVPFLTLSGLQPLTGPNAEGLYYYELATAVDVPRGTHQMTVSAINLDGESQPSTVLAATITGKGPKNPKGLRIPQEDQTR